MPIGRRSWGPCFAGTSRALSKRGVEVGKQCCCGYAMTLGDSISYRLRRRRDVALRELIQTIYRANGNVRIVDLGGSVVYWRRVGFEFLAKSQARVTLINVDQTELIPADAPHDVFDITFADACSLPQFGDAEFDLAHSNSVIEHVGSWSRMKDFARELRRVGRNHYVQTPYYWFPVDPHFYKFPLFHWLPRPTRAALLNALPLAHAGRIPGVDMANEVLERTQLLDWRQFRFLFPDSDLRFERIAGLPKSMIATRVQPVKDGSTDTTHRKQPVG